MTTRPDVRRLLRKWTRILRLLDWDIEVEVKRYHEMPHDLGRAHVNRAGKQARIELLDPFDFCLACTWTDRDMEITLVHELLHVHLPGDLDAGEGTSVMYEAGIDAIAQALVREHRRAAA